MSEVWIDIMTSKQVWFLGTFAQYLKDKGIKTWVTVRKYQENTEVLEKAVKAGRFDFEYEITGVHGGAGKEGKLDAFLARCSAHAKKIEEHDVKCAFSLSSPECARIAYGLGIPHICTSDSPFSQAASLLTFPLSEKIITSYLSDIWDFMRVGADPNRIITFKGIDEIAWTRDFKADPKILEDIGLAKGKPIAIVRALSPHFSENAPFFKDTETGVEDIIKELLKQCGKDVQIVAIPRYGQQGPILRKVFGGRIKVVEHVDGPSLSSQADVLISAGGTMNREASLLGTYAISIDPLCKHPMAYGEKFLHQKGLLLPTLDLKEAADKAIEILNDKGKRDEIKKKAAKLRTEMEDPIPVFHRVVKDYI
ncbi:MAG: DUF354 domain-containing protein [Candidatus Altiarchaeota archaeon]